MRTKRVVWILSVFPLLIFFLACGCIEFKGPTKSDVKSAAGLDSSVGVDTGVGSAKLNTDSKPKSSAKTNAPAGAPASTQASSSSQNGTAAQSTGGGHVDTNQVPTWSKEDLDFFLHGSMSTEIVPENVLRAFIVAFPDLFPKRDLSNLGLIPDPAFGWPVGFSRKEVPHLGGLPSVGLNCAACHVAEVVSAPGATPVRVLGMTSQFDSEAFFGALIAATFRPSDPANMKKFLTAYLAVNDPSDTDKGADALSTEWQKQEEKITNAMAADPFGTNVATPGALLHEISAKDLQLKRDLLTDGMDLSLLAQATLKLCHNMRASLHVPDVVSTNVPPASGPGRNDAFGTLSLVLFGQPEPFAPVKYGLVWNVENRYWVHWDGNTRSELARNLLASLGLGAPLIGKRGHLDFGTVKHQTDLSEKIHPPKYPFAIDKSAAKRGAVSYQAKCALCHEGEESDARLHSPDEVGTEPTRANVFDTAQAQRFNDFLADLEIPGYQPPQSPAIRSTQKYWAASLGGVWARSPYLHNGSVRTMADLLNPPASRAKSFHRGSPVYDAAHLGYNDEGAFVLDTTTAGNANTGHNYGTDLTPAAKKDLIEYLKTL